MYHWPQRPNSLTWWPSSIKTPELKKNQLVRLTSKNYTSYFLIRNVLLSYLATCLNQLNRISGWTMWVLRRKFNFRVTMKKESKTKCILKFHFLPTQIWHIIISQIFSFLELWWTGFIRIAAEFLKHLVHGLLLHIPHLLDSALSFLESVSNKNLTWNGQWKWKKSAEK